MGFQFTTGVGRVVQGDVFAGSDKDNKGQPLVFKSGPNKGAPRTQWFMAVAFPKMVQDPRTGQMIQNPEVAALFAQMTNEARTGYPRLFNAQGQCTHPTFAWKFTDGDTGTLDDGTPVNGKPGFAGHYVFKFSSNFPPKVVVNGAYTTDPNTIKRGYWVRVMGDCAANIGSDKPGLYMNHAAVEFVAYGEEIKGGIDAIGGFAAAGGPAYLPPGASLTPPAPVGAIPGTAAPGGFAAPGTAAPGGFAAPGGMAQQPMVAPGGMAQQPMTPPAMHTPAGITPNHQFVQQAIAAPGTAAPGGFTPPGGGFTPPVQQAAPTYTPTPAAQGFTLDQWMQSSGKSADDLVAAGYFIRS